MDFYFYFSNFCLTNVTTRPYVFICPQTAKLPSLHQLAATAWMQSVTELRTHQKLWFCFFPSRFLLVSGCLLSRFAEPSVLHKSFAQVEAFVGTDTFSRQFARPRQHSRTVAFFKPTVCVI